MNQTEINQILEELSNEFGLTVSNHFKERGIDVQLKTLDFNIVNSINKTNGVKNLEENINESSIEVIATHCYVNEQGQTVCKN
jgi:hypothetical protein